MKRARATSHREAPPRLHHGERPESDRRSNGTGSTAASRAWSSSAQSLLGVQRLAGNAITLRVLGGSAPLQRQLVYNQPLQAADIQIVTELKAGSVWRLESANGDRIVVKAEVYNPNEGAGPYAARHAVTTEFAPQLPGAPDVVPLPGPDQTVLNGLPAGTPGGGLASLKATLAGAPNTMMFKAQHVDVGKSLGDVFMPRQGAVPIAPAPYIAHLKKGSVHLQLGRIAAFDLMLGNTDRFRVDHGAPSANLDNLDFTAHGPAAIDNVDPNSDLRQGWDGERFMTTSARRRTFAAGIVPFLLLRANINLTVKQVGTLMDQFHAGMDAGVAALTQQRNVFRLRAAAETNPDKHAVMGIVSDRLMQLT